MERRGFLRAMLAAGMAPAVVKAASLMPVRALPSGLLIPEVIGRTFADNLTASMRHAGLVLGDIITLAGVMNAEHQHRQFVVTAHSETVITVARMDDPVQRMSLTY